MIEDPIEEEINTLPLEENTQGGIDNITVIEPTDEMDSN